MKEEEEEKSLSRYWLRYLSVFRGARNRAPYWLSSIFLSGLLPGVPRKMHVDASFQRLWV